MGIRSIRIDESLPDHSVSSQTIYPSMSHDGVNVHLCAHVCVIACTLVNHTYGIVLSQYFQAGRVTTGYTL